MTDMYRNTGNSNDDEIIDWWDAYSTTTSLEGYQYSSPVPTRTSRTTPAVAAEDDNNDTPAVVSDFEDDNDNDEDEDEDHFYMSYNDEHNNSDDDEDDDFQRVHSVPFFRCIRN